MRKLIAALLTAAVALTTVSLTRADAQQQTVLPRIESYTPPGAQLGYLRRADTKERFTPRGANYVRLASFTMNDKQLDYHATFEPGLYDGPRANAAFDQLQHDGYNTVRVFIDPGDVSQADAGHPHGLGRGSKDTSPLYLPYMVNVGDFVKRATAHGIYVQFAMDAFPQNLYYHGKVGPVDPTQIAGNNLYFLHPGMVQVKALYLTNFVNGLRDQIGAAGMSGVLGYATDNEAFVVGDQAPFNRTSGSVATADGLSYDMSRSDQRQQAQDANFVHYAITMKDAVHAADPDALTTMGAFTYAAVQKPGPQGLPLHCTTDCDQKLDYRYPVRLASLTTWAKLPYVDLHLYPGQALQQNLDSIEWPLVKGPVVVGEFGAFKSQYADITQAAYGMRDLQKATCALGMSGWLFWTYDTDETADQRRLYTLSQDGGAINGVLAPIVRPQPCN